MNKKLEKAWIEIIALRVRQETADTKQKEELEKKIVDILLRCCPTEE